MREKSLAWAWGVMFTLATFASGLFSWLTPLPFFYIGRRYSIRLAFLGWLSVAVLVALIYSFLLDVTGGQSKISLIDWFLWLPGMSYYKQFGSGVVFKILAVYLTFNISFSLLLTWKSTSESNIAKLVSWVAFGSLGCTAIAILWSIGPSHLLAFIDFLRKYTLLGLDQFIALNKSTGTSFEEIVYIQQNREVISEAFVRVIPGILLSSVFFIVWLNLFIARRLFRPFRLFDKVQDLVLFRVSFVGVWGVVLGLALFLLNLYVIKKEFISFALFNLLIVFSMVYFFQGLAILGFFLATRKVAPWIRLICYLLLIFLIQPLGLVLVGVGFFDSWYDFRKIAPQARV